MNKSAANPAEFEQKILNLVKNRKYLDFVKSHALSGGGLGAMAGAGMNVAGTAAKQMRGDMTDETPGDILKQYLGAAGKGAVTGGMIGGTLGGMRGVGVRRGLRKGQLNEVKNMLRGGANPEHLYNELIAGGHVNPMTMGEYLQKGLPKRRISDYAAEHFYSEPGKLPAEKMLAREKAKEGIESFALSGDRAHLDSAGLSELEKDILTKKHREITGAGGSAFEHPEYNDLKERMLNARHVVPAARPESQMASAISTPELSHLDKEVAKAQQEHDRLSALYGHSGDPSHTNMIETAHHKLTNISRARHHFNEYNNLRVTDPEKATEHLLKSRQHMEAANIPKFNPAAEAPSVSNAPQASGSKATADTGEVPAPAGEKPKYEHKNYEAPRSEAPLENKKRGVMSKLKRRAAAGIKSVKDDVSEMLSSMKSSPKAETPVMQALRDKELALKTEGIPAQTYVRESKSPTRQMTPYEQAEGNKRQLVPQHIEKNMPSYSEKKVETPKPKETPSQPEAPKQPKADRGFRRLVPDDVERKQKTKPPTEAKSHADESAPKAESHADESAPKAESQPTEAEIDKTKDQIKAERRKKITPSQAAEAARRASERTPQEEADRLRMTLEKYFKMINS